jgi:hypothetical protein
MFEDLKDLDKFFKICRKHGIETITFKDLIVKFGEAPMKTINETNESDSIPTDELSHDELIYYAVENAGAS